MRPGCCKLRTGGLPAARLPLLPLPLIDGDEILMLWLLAGAQPAQGSVGAGRAGWREGMPHGDTESRAQPLLAQFCPADFCCPRGEGVLVGGWTYPKLSLHPVHP